ncbi:MAG TPA: 2-C-methyl-D-erythritol 2,4-cyclodiphosphate synthase, partial [Turneriella sp.]|nr:2-C-methyl-D-erythritol 2,4-cyclodiphosphate synthase [Turneriella sp.]
MRVGLGYDIHRTQSGSSIVLGGVTFDAPFSLVGHSDADALLHAITDAILGALADYDIGYYFPPSKEENKKRASSDFLFFAVERMRTRGYAIENIDCNVICEVP